MVYFHEIDILKGIAVICMIIFHIYYFPNQYGYREFDYKTFPLQTIAKIAQLIFITCVGINLVLSNQKKDVYPWNRILNLVFLASCMSLFSYFIFESKYIKFGILHFIAFVSILLLPFINNIESIHRITFFFGILFLLLKKKPEIFLGVKQPFAFIMGFYNDRYYSIDHFSILPWIFVVLSGVYIGHYLVDTNYTSSIDISKHSIMNTFAKIGKRSLEIYILHWVILYIYYVHIYKSMIH
tara:strand:+ start:4543 stop:5262 length:720 start_codon:yes stop_codon:yes gene_type:complete